jgi:hypothetical protein
MGVGPLPKQSINLVGQLIITVPPSLAQPSYEIASQLGGAVRALHQRGHETVAGQLEPALVGADVDAAEQVDDRRSVAAVHGRPQGGALLLGVHLALRSLALRSASRGPSDADVIAGASG